MDHACLYLFMYSTRPWHRQIHEIIKTSVENEEEFSSETLVLDLFDSFSIFYSLQSDLFDFRMDWIWFVECHVKCSSWYVFPFEFSLLTQHKRKCMQLCQWLNRWFCFHLFDWTSRRTRLFNLSWWRLSSSNFYPSLRNRV